MKARIHVQSYDASIWRGFERAEYNESTHLVGEGECISTEGLGVTYRFEITGIRPGTVELVIRPDLLLQFSEQEQPVGALTLEVGNTARLQTPSFDAWGNWLVSLIEVV